MEINKFIINSTLTIILSLSSFAALAKNSSGLKICGHQLPTPIYAKCNGTQTPYPIPANGCLTADGHTYIPWVYITELGSSIECDLYSGYKSMSKIATLQININETATEGEISKHVINSNYDINIVPDAKMNKKVALTINPYL